MTLRDLVEGGVTLEGPVLIQCWVRETDPDIYWEGNAEDGLLNGELEPYMDRNIQYVFPFTPSPDKAAICIELEPA